MVNLSQGKRRTNSVTLVLASAVLALTGCAGTDGVQLPQLPAITTGSIPNPVNAVSEHIGEMAEATGAVQSPARKRLDELYAIDQRCYAIIAQDEVWQAFKAERATHSPRHSPEENPPVNNPWTPENEAFHSENCTEHAQASRHAEMRLLRL